MDIIFSSLRETRKKIYRDRTYVKKDGIAVSTRTIGGKARFGLRTPKEMNGNFTPAKKDHGRKIDKK